MILFHSRILGALLRGAFAALAAGVFLYAVAACAAACIGDCNGNGQVTVDELLVGVNIALENAPISDCLNFDTNADNAVTVDELLAAVNAALDGCPPEPVFPANYRDTFTEVRNCRFSTEHGGVDIRVLANPVAVQPYLNNANPLPVGSIVVKEEFDDSTCNDAKLIRWRAMRKEAPGFHPVDGNWHWQWVNPDRSVLYDDKSTCIGCHTRPECLARDYMCTVNAPRGTLQLVFKNLLPAALLSVAGTSARDVYAVGADPPNDDFGPYVLHYDGQRWRRLNTGATGDLWWISVTPIDGSFYMVGEGGLILRYDLSAGTFEKQTPPGNAVLYGIWGTSSNHLWAVGGDPSNDSTGGVVWRFDGVQWSVEDLSAVVPNGLPTLYKVWGRNEADVYAVGRLGIVLHFDGLRWSEVTSTSAPSEALFTVHGNDTQVVAVGGIGSGAILELADGSFVDRTAPGTPQMNGVFVPPDGQAVAVGIGGTLALRTATGWQLPDTGLGSFAQDFHAVWVDPEGGIWTVGGELVSGLDQGVLAYGGLRTISPDIVPIAPCPPGTRGGPMTVSYKHDIVPLFSTAGCLGSSCHGGIFPSSNYSLGTYEGAFGPGVEAKSLKVCDIAPGNPDASYLVEKLGANPRQGAQMPNRFPPSPLTAAQIALIRTWILEGAQDDSPATPTATRTPTPNGTPTRTRTPTARASTTGALTLGPTSTPNAACAVAGAICTVAGTGQSLFDGDGKPALQTALYDPLEVTFDGLGRPLILDWNNLRIRRINADGTVETIMGLDYEAFPTDGALAVDTPLHHASDMEFDRQGNLYVAGDHAPVVFRVGTDNIVHIVAGTGDAGYDGDGRPALQAKLVTPFGVTPSNDGGFYISDVDADVIRYVDPHGIISTVAGTGVRGYFGDAGLGTAAQLGGPARMRLDGSGNLYFTELRNHVVRRLAVDGHIGTFAGTGKAGYSGDNGPADQAQFNTPYDLRFAPNGDLYVADSENNVVRRIDRNGTVTTVVGTQQAGFSGDFADGRACKVNRPAGLNFDADGALWIADTYNQRVRRVAQLLSLYP